MSDDTSALKKTLNDAPLEEQKNILRKFMVTNIDKNVLEGIRIANEAYTITVQNYVVSSHVKE